jgi:hypothetical protein
MTTAHLAVSTVGTMMSPNEAPWGIDSARMTPLQGSQAPEPERQEQVEEILGFMSKPHRLPHAVNW